MRRLFLSSLLVGALVLGVASPLGAAPPESNPNYATFTADCTGDDQGPFTVVTTEQGSQAFDEDGRPLVLKGLTVTDNATLTVGDQSLPVGGEFAFDKNGQGYQGRIVECDFVQEFTDTFTFRQRDARFLDDVAPLDEGSWSQYIGETATVTGTATGTARVLRPGR